MVTLSAIYIYEGIYPPEYKIEEIIDYLKNLFPKTTIEKKKPFFSFLQEKKPFLSIDDIAKEITLCRVHQVNKEIEEFLPLPLEIEYEKKRLKNQKQIKGIIYDGFRLQSVCSKLLGLEEFSPSTCHIIFTNQLIASFDENDKRYHLRVGIYGSPNIISTPGPMQALAKPREYYLKLQMGLDPITLEQEFKEEIIDDNDSRLTEILKGYCLQGLLYHLEGVLFCEDKNCRLYNAHWQKDVIVAQIEARYEFCSKHSKIIDKYKDS